MGWDSGMIMRTTNGHWESFLAFAFLLQAVWHLCLGFEKSRVSNSDADVSEMLQHWSEQRLPSCHQLRSRYSTSHIITSLTHFVHTSDTHKNAIYFYRHNGRSFFFFVVTWQVMPFSSCITVTLIQCLCPYRFILRALAIRDNIYFTITESSVKMSWMEFLVKSLLWSGYDFSIHGSKPSKNEMSAKGMHINKRCVYSDGEGCASNSSSAVCALISFQYYIFFSSLSLCDRSHMKD